MTAARGPQYRRAREHKRRPINARAVRFSVLFEPCRPVHSVVRQLGAPNMVDINTRWLAVPSAHADDVLAMLEARGYAVALSTTPAWGPTTGGAA